MTGTSLSANPIWSIRQSCTLQPNFSLSFRRLSALQASGLTLATCVDALLSCRDRLPSLRALCTGQYGCTAGPTTDKGEARPRFCDALITSMVPHLLFGRRLAPSSRTRVLSWSSHCRLATRLATSGSGISVRWGPHGVPPGPAHGTNHCEARRCRHP
jgi:hypothetical protein